MANNKTLLPHESTDLFLTDGGLETTLVFLEGFDLPHFAAFHLLKEERGYAAIQNYYRRYLKIAKQYRTGFILESPTWRANPDWFEKMDLPESAISEVNEKAVKLMLDLKEEYTGDLDNIVISGCVGPRGDGYKSGNKMSAEEAEKYHLEQIKVFKKTPVDMVSAITMNYVEEAIGIARAAGAVNLPVVISFTVETDGKLASGMILKEAILRVDESVEKAPIYYMINCAHPTHFKTELEKEQSEHWIKRLKGIRANSSFKSHAELDDSIELDRGNPRELSLEYKKLKNTFPHLNIFGGCCGTDEEHVLEIIKQVRNA